MKFDVRGYILSLPFLVIGVLIAYFRSFNKSIPIILASVFLLIFHRIPERKTPKSGIIAPSDGKVTDFRETDNYVEFSTYLGLSDVHVFYAPCTSDIVGVERIDGGNKPAFLNESEKNERLLYKFESGVEVVVMTGFLARRIKSYVGVESVERGERIGIISFGSRTNIRIPKDEFERIEAEEEQVLVGGESVIAS